MGSVFNKLKRDNNDRETRKRNREQLEIVREMFWDLRKILIWTDYELTVPVWSKDDYEKVKPEEIEDYYKKMDSLLDSVTITDKDMKRSMRALRFALQQHKERLLRLEPSDERSKMALYQTVEDVVNALNELRSASGERDMDFAWG